MKILLFGKGGQVGWELQRSLAPLGELIALDFDSAGLCGDFTRLEDLAATLREVAPDGVRWEGNSRRCPLLSCLRGIGYACEWFWYPFRQGWIRSGN
jgi:hypothetical protein